jgi:hypothetical protein
MIKLVMRIADRQLSVCCPEPTHETGEYCPNYETSRWGRNVRNLRQTETWLPLSGDASAEEPDVASWDAALQA